MAVSKPIWMELPDKLFNFDPDMGAVTAIALGPSGSGKTHLLIHIAKRKLYDAKEICVWRGLHSAQAFQYFQDVRILVLRGYTLSHPEYIDEYFDDMPELEPGVLNVIYAPVEWWREYLIRLTEVHRDMPMSVFCDEFEEIAPSYAAEETWHVIGDLSKALREFRKAWVNFYAATQEWINIDHRVLALFIFRIYLPGARRLRRSPVWQKTIDALAKHMKPDKRRAIIEERGALFYYFEFPKAERVRQPIKLNLRPAYQAIEETPPPEAT